MTNARARGSRLIAHRASRSTRGGAGWPFEATPAKSGHRESRSSDKLPLVLSPPPPPPPPPAPHIVLHFRLVIQRRVRHRDDDDCRSALPRAAKGYFNRKDISLSLSLSVCVCACDIRGVIILGSARSAWKTADELDNRVTSQLFIVAFTPVKGTGCMHSKVEL